MHPKFKKTQRFLEIMDKEKIKNIITNIQDKQEKYTTALKSIEKNLKEAKKTEDMHFNYNQLLDEYKKEFNKVIKYLKEAESSIANALEDIYGEEETN